MIRILFIQGAVRPFSTEAAVQNAVHAVASSVDVHGQLADKV
jgi:hypothetical protein